MKKFDLFNKFNNAVIVINKKNEVIFCNHIFNRIFGELTSLKKFSHKLNFDACNLNTENLEMYSHIYQAIDSPQNFFTTVSYQENKKEILYFNVTAINKSNYLIVMFDDITSEKRLENLQEDYTKISKELDKQIKENNNFIKIRQQAQTQAIKMALINKVSNSIRKSIDLHKIISSALKELREMLGAFKVYYASCYNHAFK